MPGGKKGGKKGGPDVVEIPMNKDDAAQSMDLVFMRMLAALLRLCMAHLLSVLSVVACDSSSCPRLDGTFMRAPCCMC